MTPEHPAKHPEGLLITNEQRLNHRQWLVVLVLVTLVALVTPPLWRRLERFDTGADYRIPYHLSNDYWLFDWRLQQTAAAKPLVLLGDSVVWGEYVRADGTLSHFLNQQAGQPEHCINAGVNGLFPLALEGLVRYYGGALRHGKVIVVCNLLWLSSPKADLHDDKAQDLNHAALVPQFLSNIPAYQADASARLSAMLGQRVGFFGWANHLQCAYFNQQGLTRWTLDEDPNQAQHYPNTYRNPFAQVTLKVPAGHADDATRGPGSERHKPWSAGSTQPTEFEWVSLDSSLQWAALQRTVGLLRARGNDVLVIVAPFNEAMMNAEGVTAYRKLRGGISNWLDARHVPHIVPDTLPGDLYADASHPLTAGYELLATRIYQGDGFKAFWDSGK
jgi:hypothetical protein